MSFLIPDEGLEALLQDIIDNVLPTAKVHLFTNTHTPAAGDTVADYTEPTWPGYAAASGVVWSGPVVTSSIAYTDSDLIEYAVTGSPGAEVVRGYYVTDSTSAILYFAENIASPVTPVVGIDVQLQVRFRFRNP